MILVTVRHTGTTSLKKQYPQADQIHCGEDDLARTRDGERTLTTYRNPDDVVRSWLNRGWFEHKKFALMWDKGWDAYRSLSTMPNVEVVTMDKLDHHLNHTDEPDLQFEGLFLDSEMIKHAHECSEWATNNRGK